MFAVLWLQLHPLNLPKSMQLRYVFAVGTLLVLAACMDVNITQELVEEPDSKELALAPATDQFKTFDDVFAVVEEDPALVGGQASLMQQINYPEIAQKAGVEGRVFLQFVVDENGDVHNATVTRGIGAGCDEEALRVIRNAKFTPGMQKGEPVKVRMSMSVLFKLRNADTATDTKPPRPKPPIRPSSL